MCVGAVWLTVWHLSGFAAEPACLRESATEAVHSTASALATRRQGTARKSDGSPGGTAAAARAGRIHVVTRVTAHSDAADSEKCRRV